MRQKFVINSRKLRGFEPQNRISRKDNPMVFFPLIMTQIKYKEPNAHTSLREQRSTSQIKNIFILVTKRKHNK